MKILPLLAGLSLLVFFVFPSSVLAASSNPDISSYVVNTLDIITVVASALAVLVLVRGGYLYMTSVGRPEALEEAKKTIRNAILGLVIVLAAGLIISVFRTSLTPQVDNTTQSVVNLTPVDAIKPSNGLVQVLIDAVFGFMQNLVGSATKPITDGVIGFLTSTPGVLNNSVIRNFWLVTLGITDSLFVIVVALLGLQMMSASTLGFEEIEFKHVLPRIGLAFIGANTSLFLADYAIVTCNTLVKAVLDATGGLNQTIIVDVINPTTFISGNMPLIFLVFMVLFLILAIVLLLMYISRLIIISLGAVLAPFIFLIWTLPKFADFAELAIKSYLVSVFTVFVHVVIIQLASAYLALPAHTENSLLSVAVAAGLFFTMLKVPSTMMQLVLHGTNSGAVKKMSSQIINVITRENPATNARNVPSQVVKTPRKAINV